MSKIFKYKEYSPIDIGKMNENNIDFYYEIIGIDAFGDEWMPPEEEEDANYNPFDLKDMVRLLIKKNKKYDDYNLSLMKIIKEKVPLKTIKQIKIEIEAKKYNI